ncbi:MAG: hypothetical protein ISR65_02650 [Bacteriovoracaceae bacterium]|nr:hypothetical protein [Bacteriovoracaceae bacterium]
MTTTQSNVPKLHHEKLQSLITQKSALFDFNESFIAQVNEDVQVLDSYLRSKTVTTQWSISDWYKLFSKSVIPDDVIIFNDKHTLEVALWKEDEKSKTLQLTWCRAKIQWDASCSSKFIYTVQESGPLISAPIAVKTKLYKQLPILLEFLSEKIANNTGYLEQ